MAPRFPAPNSALKRQWADRYLDLIAAVADDEGKMPVFTPDRKFFSQDCLHLTEAGAVEFSRRLDLGARFSLRFPE